MRTVIAALTMLGFVVPAAAAVPGRIEFTSVDEVGPVGQGALALGCIAAAVTGHVELGIPCVVGGAALSAALSVWNNQQ
jgi:hypothetical protein